MQAQISRAIRSRIAAHLLDHSGVRPDEAAVYILADPRDIQQVRYVGQTRSPRRRLLQHLGNARLWMPDELPWWTARPKMRPLHEWIRELYRDEQRLPVMVVVAWTQAQQALHEERRHICRHLGAQLPLLNREAAANSAQLALL